MPEILIKVPAKKKFLDNEWQIIIDVEASDSWELFPSYLKFPGGKHQLVIASNGGGEERGLLTCSIPGEELDPIMSMFGFVDDTFTITCEGELKVSNARMVSPSGPIKDGVEVAAGSVMTATSCKQFDMPSSRVMLKINVHAPSQLSIDLFEDQGERSFGEIMLS